MISKKDKDIQLMQAEVRLDRLQCILRKRKQFDLEKEARKALGNIRSVIRYYDSYRQKTLKSFGCLSALELRQKHHAKYIGNLQIVE